MSGKQQVLGWIATVIGFVIVALGMVSCTIDQQRQKNETIQAITQQGNPEIMSDFLLAKGSPSG